MIEMVPIYCRTTIYDDVKRPAIWKIKPTPMPKIRTLKIVSFRSPNNRQYYFHILGGNGKIVAASEGYRTKQACLKTVRRLLEAKLIFKA